MPSLTVALLLLEWLHDGVYAGQCLARVTLTHTLTLTSMHQHTEIRAANAISK